MSGQVAMYFVFYFSVRRGEGPVWTCWLIYKLTYFPHVTDFTIKKIRAIYTYTFKAIKKGDAWSLFEFMDVIGLYII